MIENIFFEVYSKDDEGGVAFAPTEFLYEYFEKIKDVDQLPFYLTIEEGAYQDYLSNDLGWPLMSLKLKTCIEKFAAKAPKHKWVKANVLLNDLSVEYFYLVFLEKPNVLDRTKTKIVNDDYMHGVFSYTKIEGYDFFSHESAFNNNIIISNRLKSEIEETNISGVCLEKADVQ